MCNWFVLHLLSEDRHGIKFTLGWDRCKVKGIHSSQICDNLGWALIIIVNDCNTINENAWAYDDI